MSGRCLGVDFGTKRIGLALSEPGGIVSPLKVLDARPDTAGNARAILEVAHEYGVDTIVVGLPLNMDGTEGSQAKLSKALSRELKLGAAAGGPKVLLHDERLTSHAADHRLSDRALTRKKKKARHDAVAAQVLLQSYLAKS